MVRSIINRYVHLTRNTTICVYVINWFSIISPSTTHNEGQIFHHYNMRNGTKLALYQHNTSKERKTRRRCITKTERPKPQEHPVPERLHPKTCNETNQASQTKIPKPEAPRRNPANVKDKKDLRETLVSRRNATQRSRFLFPFPSGLSPREPRGTCSGRLQVGPRPGVAVKRAHPP